MRRRTFLQASAAALAAAPLYAGPKANFPVGVTDWNLKQSADPAAVELAKRCGFEGVQVALGRQLVDDKLPLDNAEIQQTYLAESKKHGVKLTSTCVDRLHVNYLKNDKLGQRWVSDGIRITKALGLQVMLLPFFGDGQIKERAEQDYIADVMKELGPEAGKAGVILGLENTISAEENVRIMERSQSPAVETYYDIGNSTLQGYDPVREIRWLGADRICEIHIKDNPHFLGEGSIAIPGVVAALADIGFGKWAVLETSVRQDVVADMKRHLGYFQDVIARQNQA